MSNMEDREMKKTAFWKLFPYIIIIITACIMIVVVIVLGEANTAQSFPSTGAVSIQNTNDTITE